MGIADKTSRHPDKLWYTIGIIWTEREGESKAGQGSKIEESPCLSSM